MRRSLTRLGLAALLASAFAGFAVSQPVPAVGVKKAADKDDHGPKPDQRLVAHTD